MTDLKHCILDYMVRAPDACDTAQGITEWWLLEQRIRSALVEVREALEELTRQGWLSQLVHADGRTRYRLRQERLVEIRSYLAASRKQDAGTSACQDKVKH